MYAKDLNELKYQFLIKKREDVGIKHLNDSKAFIEYSAYICMMFTMILMIITQIETEKV